MSKLAEEMARLNEHSGVMPALVAGIHDHRRGKQGIGGDHGLPGRARQ
jgi:hypothetical protein